jgi:hypothetical protein
LLIGNRYFSPDTKPEVITDYFRLLENKLDTNNFRVILLGDFNAPGFNWGRGLPLPNSHYYSKLKGDAIYTSTCFLGFRQCVKAVDSHNLLDLVFDNFSDLKPDPADSGLVKPDSYHPPLNIYIYLPHITNNLNCEFRFFVISLLAIILCCKTFFPRATGQVCTTLFLVTKLSPASMLLFEMPWSRPFLVAITASPNSLPGSLIP